VAYLGHLDAVKPGLTVTENLAFAAGVSGRPIIAALTAVGLDALAELPARMLSAGQKRRLALSRLLLSAAPLWLLDEPTLGLDTASIDRFGGLLAAHRKAGGMVVAATHVPLPLTAAAELRLG
jgi:heme exporter protein A